MRRKPLAPLTPEQQQLAADNERLIYLAIHRYAPDEDADELYGHAAEGLLRAASTYDPTRGKFSTHAMWCIRSEIAHRKKYAQQRKRPVCLFCTRTIMTQRLTAPVSTITRSAVQSSQRIDRTKISTIPRRISAVFWTVSRRCSVRPCACAWQGIPTQTLPTSAA